MIRRPPRSSLFPYTTPSDLAVRGAAGKGLGVERGEHRRFLAFPEPRLPAHQAACRERARSEEHTSELQSRLHLVCRLLLEKKKNTECTTRPLIASCVPTSVR